MRDCSFKPKTNRHELGTTVSISEFSPDFNVVSESMLKIGEVEMDSLFQYRKSDSNF